MLCHDWYKALASLNRAISEGRARIKKQETLVSKSAEEDWDAESAIAILQLLNESLQLLIVRRGLILRYVRSFPLPTYENVLHWGPEYGVPVTIALRRPPAAKRRRPAPVERVLRFGTTPSARISSDR